MTELYFDRWAWRCKNCNKMLALPGIVPDIKEMNQAEWKFCPCCGKEIDFDKTEKNFCKGNKK